MFDQLEALIAARAGGSAPLVKAPFVFQVHPRQLERWLEETWADARRAPQLQTYGGQTLAFVDPKVVDVLRFPTLPFMAELPDSGISGNVAVARASSATGLPMLWHHLIYAYLVESTGIVDIVAQVLRRIVGGETLGALSPESLAWARATEQLFFRDPPEFAITGVVSEVRANARENRRFAYKRFFGLPLPHEIPEAWRPQGMPIDWNALMGAGWNPDFRQKWTDLLRQVWIGSENINNSGGPNPVDPKYIAMLCHALHDMFANRRRGGALAREEFAYVSMLNWFHLTVESNTPIVSDLQATASSPADRLAAIADRVGLRSAPRSRELFELARPTSTILRGIEMGLFDTAAGARALYQPGTQIEADMITIVNNWQSATGDYVKEQRAAVTPGSRPTPAQPLRAPSPGVLASTEGTAQPVPRS
jgi:hypothetical protein